MFIGEIEGRHASDLLWRYRWKKLWRGHGCDEYAEIEEIKLSATQEFEIVAENRCTITKFYLDKNAILPEIALESAHRRVLKGVVVVERCKQFAVQFWEHGGL